MTRKNAKNLYPTSPNQLSRHRLEKHLNKLNLADTASYEDWCKVNGFGTGKRKSWRQKREELKLAEKQSKIHEAELTRYYHYISLGFENLEEYTNWCLANDFPTTMNKTPEQKKREAVYLQSITSKTIMEDKNRYPTPFEDVLDAIQNGNYLNAQSTVIPYEEIRTAFMLVGQNKKDRKALRVLLLRLKDTRLLSLAQAYAHLGVALNNTYIGVLANIARHRAFWIRPLECWKPETRSPKRQLQSLIRHLFAEYTVPSFFEGAWGYDESIQGERYRGWFLHIANGQNIRTADIPFRLTKMSAHLAMNASGDTPIITALRYGQVRGLGGSAQLARYIVSTRLRDTLPDEPFWESVIHFCINNPTLTRSEVEEIVDYLYFQKFVPIQVFQEDGTIVESGPAQPNLSMKGRTAEALQRQIRSWLNELTNDRQQQRVEWTPCGILEFWTHLQADDKMQLWGFQEVLNSKELTGEGRFMHNCVATYLMECQRHTSSIWVLRMRPSAEEPFRSVLNIEISLPERRIVQVRGRFNRSLDAEEADNSLNIGRQLLKQWAKAQSLTIDTYAF